MKLLILLLLISLIIALARGNMYRRSAEKLGCTCPVIDNHFGKGRPNGEFIFDMECPVHSVEDILFN